MTKSKSSKKKQSATVATVKVTTSAGKKSGKKKSGGGKRKSGVRVMGGSQVSIGAAVDFEKIETVCQFGPARSEKGFRSGLNCKFTVAGLEVGLMSTSAVNGCALFGVASSSTALTVPTSIDPSVSNRWLNQVIGLLTGIFDRYRVNKFSLHYRPAAGNTSISAPMAFGICSDFNHPNWSSATVGQILGFGTSFEFNAAWEAFDVDYLLPHGNLLYSYDVGTSTGDYRFQDAGAFTILTMAASSVLIKYGLLYLSWDVDLYELAPVYHSVTLTRELHSSGHDMWRPGRKFDLVAPGIDDPQRDSVDEKKSDDFQVVKGPLKSLLPSRPLNGPPVR